MLLVKLNYTEFVLSSCDMKIFIRTNTHTLSAGWSGTAADARGKGSSSQKHTKSLSTLSRPQEPVKREERISGQL